MSALEVGDRVRLHLSASNQVMLVTEVCVDIFGSDVTKIISRDGVRCVWHNKVGDPQEVVYPRAVLDKML